MLELNKIPDRNLVYPRDIGNLMGRSSRTGRRVARKICDELGKEYMGFVLVPDACNYFKMTEEELRKYLKDWQYFYFL